MPFTPLHLGFGAAAKALGGPRFSFMVFGGAQVLMDIEPLVRIVLGSPILHGPTHTLAGALAIGVVAALTGKPVSEFVLRVRGVRHAPLTWAASWIGALVGTFSHVVLDAVMHDDMTPWWPLATGNALHGAIGLDRLHSVLLVLGALGALGWFLRRRRDTR